MFRGLVGSLRRYVGTLRYVGADGLTPSVIGRCVRGSPAESRLFAAGRYWIRTQPRMPVPHHCGLGPGVQMSSETESATLLAPRCDGAKGPMAFTSTAIVRHPIGACR